MKKINWLVVGIWALVALQLFLFVQGIQKMNWFSIIINPIGLAINASTLYKIYVKKW